MPSFNLRRGFCKRTIPTHVMMDPQDEAYSEAMDEIARLKALLVRAADMLEKWNIRHRFNDLIDELRRAAK